MKKDKSTLTGHQNGPFETDMARYQAILDEIQVYLNTFPDKLKPHALPFFEKMVAGEFSQVVALLPYWLTDLLPVSDEICHQLGMAHLYGWWYYYVQDDLLDGDTPATTLLGGHLALIKMIEIYANLGLTASPCWQNFHQLAITSAATYALEINTHFSDLTELTPERLSHWNVDLIINRATPFYFNTVAQLFLAGIPADNPLHHDLIAALKAFTVTRQIGDDSSDWINDLKGGRLNYVSAQLMLRLYDLGSAGENGQDLDIERLAGYHLLDEPFWAQIEEVAQSQCHKALDLLQPYGDCQLQTLIQRQMDRNDKHWQASREYREKLRDIFGISPLEENNYEDKLPEA